MKSDVILQKLIKHFNKEVTLDSSIGFCIEWHSMNALLFALYIEKEFNVRLNVQMFRQETTIQELISAIQQKASS